MDVITAKIITMLLLGSVSLVVGLLPFLVKRCVKVSESGVGRSKGEIAISCLSLFGGGVILTTCLTHMLPEVQFFLNMNIKNGSFPDTGLAMAEIFVLCGFFMIYVVEEITHTVIHYMADKAKAKKANLSQGKSATNGDIIRDPSELEPMYTSQVFQVDDVPVEVFVTDDGASAFESALRGFLVCLAISLHAVFEGIALGLMHTVNSVWFLFFAIASHKFVISFCVGMTCVSSNVKPYLTVIYITTFSIISPIGTGIGIALSESVESEASLQTSLITVLQGLATGTLLYVVIFEVLEKERQKGTSGILQIAFLALGFLCMVCLELIELHTVENTEATVLSDLQNCSLQTFETSWSLPMHFQCINGTLVPWL